MASNDQHTLLKTKSFSKQLGNDIYVYVRSLEERDAVVIRNLMAAKYHTFGIKGIHRIKQLYYNIIVLLKANEAKVLSELKYSNKLLQYFDELEGNDFQASEAIISSRKKQSVSLEEDLRVDFYTYEHGYSTIGLLNIREGKRATPKSGVQLFIAQAIKLLDYLNSVYSFSQFPSKQTLVDINLEDDHFF